MRLNDHTWKEFLLRSLGTTAPFVTYSNEQDGFTMQFGFNPSANLEVTAQTPETEILRFIQSHKKSLVVFLLSYDYGLLRKGLPLAENSPEVLGYLYAYEDFIRLENETYQIHSKDPAFTEKYEETLEALLDQKQQKETLAVPTFTEGLSLEEYDLIFKELQNHIREGDFYQINFTQEKKGTYTGTGAELFIQLAESGKPHYGGYLKTKDFEMLSLSPESFMETQGRKVITRPIKGTRPRQAEDQQALTGLLTSSKEEAELFMITDLLRNDLSESCQVGSVLVTKHKDTMKLQGVFHSFSEIQGKLSEGVSPFQAFLNAFPGGSITGCPKKRSMEVISEKEGRSRGFYTGSFGYIDPLGNLNANILIRTLFKQGEELRFSVGGGITTLSKLEEEFQEMNHKMKSVLGGLQE